MPRKKQTEAPLQVSPVDVCQAYKEVFSTSAGQIVLADMLRRFGFTRSSTFVPGDSARTAFNEGGRTVLIHVGRMIDADPADFEEPTAEG